MPLGTIDDLLSLRLVGTRGGGWRGGLGRSVGRSRWFVPGRGVGGQAFARHRQQESDGGEAQAGGKRRRAMLAEKHALLLY